VGRRVGYWLLTVRNAELAGGFPSNPILSGPRRTHLKQKIRSEKIELNFSLEQAKRMQNGSIFASKKNIFEAVQLSPDRIGPLEQSPASLALLPSRTSIRMRSCPALLEFQGRYEAI
jgi:hypothetical protein